MPTLADFDAARKSGVATTASAGAEQPQPLDELLKRADALTARPSDPVDPSRMVNARPTPEVDALTDPGQGTYRQEHPNTFSQATSNPLRAMLESGASTVGRTAKGLAMSPINVIRNLPSAPGQAVEGLAGQTGLPTLLSDPSLLKGIPGALKGLYDYIGQHPEAGGDLLGQIAMGRMAPRAIEAVPGAVEGGVNAVGRGVSATGRGLGKAGEAAINNKVGGFGIPGLGALEAVFGSHPVAGVVTAAAPYAAKYGGKLLEKGGAALEGLKLTAKDNAWANDVSARPVTAPEQNVQTSTPAGSDPLAELMQSESFSLLPRETSLPYKPSGPGALEGLKRPVVSTEVPYAAEPSALLNQDISQWEKAPQPLSEGGLAELSRSIARNTRTPAYQQELGRAMNSEPTPNAAAVFDQMANEGQFAGQRAMPRVPATKPPAPKPRGRDFSKPGKPSLAGLRADIINKESLHRALSDFQP